MLSEEPVVLMAKEADVAHAVIPSHREWMPVVELEPHVLGAASSLLVRRSGNANHPARLTARRTAAGMCREAPDVSASGERAARPVVLPERRAFEALQLLGDGAVDDGREVTVGNLRPHESGEPLDLVAERGAGRELDPVAAGEIGSTTRRSERAGIAAWGVVTADVSTRRGTSSSAATRRSSCGGATGSDPLRLRQLPHDGGHVRSR
jgi:hypothetical protein